MYGLKAMLRAWGPGQVLIAGDFIITSSAIADTHPSRPGFTLSRKAAGVYLVTLAQAFAKVLDSGAHLGPDTGITGSLPTANPAAVMISKGFLATNSGGTAFAADSTGTNLVILVTNSGSLTDVPANYRCSFEIVVAESQVNK